MNIVAKYAAQFNKSHVYKDRKNTYSRKKKYTNEQVRYLDKSL